MIFGLFTYIHSHFHSSKPKFLDGHVRRIEVGWDDTKEKATTRLKLLTNTKAAWEGYAIGLETIAEEFEKAEEEIKKVKKRFNLQAACDDLAARQKIYNDTNKTITGTHTSVKILFFTVFQRIFFFEVISISYRNA